MKIKTALKLYLVSLFILCPNILWAKFVPVETARRVAVNSMNKNNQAKALGHRQKGAVEQRAVGKLTEGQITYTYTAMENDISVYYVFNFSPEGWMIISADDVAYPVIAYSESGFYDPNVSNQPSGLTAWMHNVALEISDAVALGLESLPDAALAWEQLSVAPDNFAADLGGLVTAQSVDPLIQSHWGQGGETDGWPFGYEGYSKYLPWEYTNWTHLYRDYCPTGCVATAMAQIMRYWQWPPFGHGYYKYETWYTCSHECYGFGPREVDFGQQYYNWSASSMPLNSPSDAIAKLMNDIGIAVSMDYRPNQSGSTPSKASEALHNYFRYQTVEGASKIQYSDPNWINKLKAELDAGRPILYSGFNENYTSAHTFICDGYDLSDYFHFNWGWDGSYDGWFTLNDLTPGDHNYTTSQDALFNIVPISEVYVDDDYIPYGYNDGHWFGVEAFDNIQDAILFVYPEGTVYVAAGTYYEAINFGGKAIHLYGIEGPEVTTINGNGAYHVVRCISGETANTILEGFTITGGDANSSNFPDNCAGGMYNNGSSPTVINCIFSGNSADYGGGMYNRNSGPTVINCTFSGNSAYGGGGMCNENSSSTVTNCTFTGNSVGYQGGGMLNNDNSDPVVTNCNFLYNSAYYGGGIYNISSNPIVTNCILWNDYSSEEIFNDEFSSPVVTYCDVKMPSGTYPGTGNINANPGFSGAIIMGRPECSNYLSSSASPCVDAGDSNAPNLPGTDMGGQPRVIDGDVDGNSTVDIGAYELQPCVRNITRNRWYQLIQHSVEDACDSDTIEVPLGTYYESVDLMNAPDNFVLTSIDPNDPNIVEQTIIDAKFGGHVLTFTSQGSSCVLAGFTLTVSGNPLMVPGFGYGIGSYGQITSPTIRNCNITNTLGVRFDYGSPALSGCTIKDNFGGLTVSNGSVVEDCIIANNLAIEGNGLYCAVDTSLWGNTILRRCVVSGNLCEYTAISCGGNMTIQDCVISDNTGMMGAVWSSSSPSEGKMSGCTITNNKGGGINGWAGPIENCIIVNNAGQDIYAIMSGGGIRNCTGPITGCVIRGNEAVYGGGLFGCSGPIVNCVISGNHGIHGGGLSDCDGAISNCTIVGNVAWDGPSPDVGLGGGLYECTGTISNSIIRQNWADTEGDQFYSSSVPSYSCIQDWSGGGIGNISADPCFAYPGYWADANDPNTVVAPDDPNAVWVDGFYRLDRNSPCIDAGDNSSVPGGITTDLSGLPRFIDDLCAFDSGNGTAPVVDMGAYEFLPADIDGSGAVDLRDFSEFALHWAETACGWCGGADLTGDGNVDWNDLRELTDYWLTGK